MGRIAICCVVVAFAVALPGCESKETEKTAPEGQSRVSAAVGSQIKGGLRQIGDGALAYFQEEHASPDGMTVTTNVFPEASPPACIGPDDPANTTWAELRVSALSPENITYCYESSRDLKSFAAWAEDDSALYCILGEVDRNTGGPQVSAVVVHASPSEDTTCW